MDPLTHVLLTRLLVDSDPQTLIAGVLPDLPFYVLYPGLVIRKGMLQHALQSGDWPIAPAWMQQPHHLAHSLPLVLGIALLLFYRSRHWPGWILAWALHILIDIPTHSRKQWAPQFLWPFSDLTVDGISWAELLLGLLRRGRSNGS